MTRKGDNIRAMNRAHLLALLRSAIIVLVHCTASAQGTTIAVGGALQENNHALWQHLVQRVQAAAQGSAKSEPARRNDGPQACYSIISIASSEPEVAAARVAKNLALHGGRGEHLRVGPRMPGQDSPAAVAAAVQDPAWAQRLGRCKGVYMTGGAQARLLDALQPQGQPSALLLTLRQLWLDGGVVAGSSAGTAVLSGVVFRDAPEPLAVMKGRLRRGAEWDRGFAFAPAEVILDQHAVKRGRLGRLLPLMQSQGVPLGVAVEENSAAEFQGQTILALGARGVLIADLSTATREPGATFNVQGARLHWLEAGDRFDLQTRRVTPSAYKQAGTRLQPLSATHHGYLKGGWFYADMLGDGVVVTAMTRLVDGDQRELRGLSFAAVAAAEDPAPNLAFEWRLWLDIDTQGWLVTSPEGYTLSGVRLDIVPVELQRPLYRRFNPP